MVSHATASTEAKWIGRQLLAEHARGTPWKEGGALYRSPLLSRAVETALVPPPPPPPPPLILSL